MRGLKKRLEALVGIHVMDLACAPQDWSWLKYQTALETIAIEPDVYEEVERLQAARKEVPPLAPVPVREQLGYLLEELSVTSKVTDPALSLVAGCKYPCEIVPVSTKWIELRSVVEADGTVREQPVTLRQNRLRITVSAGERPWVWLEGQSDPEEFLSRFEFRPRFSVMDLLPDRWDAALRAVRSVERDFGFSLRDWQREDVTTAVCVGRSLLAVEQGLGKTVMAMTMAEALRRFHPGAQVPFLAVVPQDLIRQWQREAYRFFRRSFVRIDSVSAALQSARAHKEGRSLQRASVIAAEVRHLVARGSDAWFLTHYEAVSRTGRQEELTETGERILWAKPAGSALSTVFRNGLIAVDEITKIKGDTDTSRGIRGLRSRYRVGLSGTPVRNTLPDLFWILWWIGGNRTARFPYGYDDGLRALLRDFGTTEKVGLVGNPTMVPEPGNLQVLRRLLAPLVIRRTAESLQAPMVPVKFVIVRAPWGARQRQQYENWLDPTRFAVYWARRHPQADTLSAQVARRHGAALGQLVHLDYATTVPESEPDRDNDPTGGPSNWTPKALFALQIIREHVRQGARVLFGSNLLGNVVWTATQLQALGLRATSLAAPAKTGKLVSLGPDPRQDAVEAFLHEGGQVLCAGLQSLALGHDLHQVSTVVVSGLPYDLMTLEQFLARVRRLRSTKPVTVVILLTMGSLDERKWELLERKRRAAQVVFCDPVSLVRDESGAVDHEQMLELVRQDAKALGAQPAESEDQVQVRFLRMCSEAATPSLERLHEAEKLQQVPPSANFEATFTVAAALSAGYPVPSARGFVAEPTATPGVFRLRKSAQLLGLGSAADVAMAFCSLLDAAEVERALRFARMPEAERQRHFGWWRSGPAEWLVVSEAEQWWRHGAYTWRVE